MAYSRYTANDAPRDEAGMPKFGPDDAERYGPEDKEKYGPEGQEAYSDAEEAIDIIRKYWAMEQDGEKLWTTLVEKATDFYDAMNRKNLFQLYRLMYSSYFGTAAFSDGAWGGQWQTQSIQFGGENGELLEMSVGELRSYFDQICNMMTKNRPAFQAEATNTDYASMASVEAADSLVKHFFEIVYGERKEKATVAKEQRYGKAYVHVEWDPDGGHDVEIEEDVDTNMGPVPAPKTVKSGEFIISSLFPWDVICEPYKSEVNGSGHNWRIVQCPPVNKYEMMYRYPLKAGQIENSSPTENTYAYQFPNCDPLAKFPDDQAEKAIFYHRPCGVMPKGRKVVFINGVMVEDDVLPIDEIPLIWLMSCEMEGTSFGSSDLWNLIPLEQMQNQILSDVATNIEAFGRPPLILPEGTDISLDALANGQKVLFWPSTAASKPEPMKYPQLTDVPFKMLESLRSYKQSLSGLNAVARGDTTSNVTSGAHAALYSQIAVEAQTPRMIDVDLSREAIANLLVKYLKDYADHPMMVSIIGVDERSYIQSISKKDLAGVQRVRVKTMNPMMKTQAGKLQVAEMLRDWPGSPMKDPTQIVELITTGQLKPLIEPTRAESLRIRYENEQLLKGPAVTIIDGPLDPMTGVPTQQEVVEDVRVLATENAMKHILGHLEIVYSPAAQKNPTILKAALTHVLEHVNQARTGDGYLAMLLQNPLPQELMVGAGGQQQQNPPKASEADDSQAQKAGATMTDDSERNDQAAGPTLPSPPAGADVA